VATNAVELKEEKTHEPDQNRNRDKGVLWPDIFEIFFQ
jgi:hypothetical protein